MKSLPATKKAQLKIPDFKRELDKWMESEDVRMCRNGVARGEYLRNRLFRAFAAGWSGALRAAPVLILAALCAIGASAQSRHSLPVRIVVDLGRNAGETAKVIVWPRGRWEERFTAWYIIGTHAAASHELQRSLSYCAHFGCVETSALLGPHPSPARNWGVWTVGVGGGFLLLNHMTMKSVDPDSRLQKFLAPLPALVIGSANIYAAQAYRLDANQWKHCLHTPSCIAKH
jgi:hypothetical protein